MKQGLNPKIKDLHVHQLELGFPRLSSPPLRKKLSRHASFSPGRVRFGDRISPSTMGHTVVLELGSRRLLLSWAGVGRGAPRKSRRRMRRPGEPWVCPFGEFWGRLLGAGSGKPQSKRITQTELGSLKFWRQPAARSRTNAATPSLLNSPHCNGSMAKGSQARRRRFGSVVGHLWLALLLPKETWTTGRSTLNFPRVRGAGGGGGVVKKSCPVLI